MQPHINGYQWISAIMSHFPIFPLIYLCASHGSGHVSSRARSAVCHPIRVLGSEAIAVLPFCKLSSLILNRPLSESVVFPMVTTFPAGREVVLGYAMHARHAAGISLRSASQRARAPGVCMIWAVREPRPPHVFTPNRQKTLGIIRDL